MTKPATIWKLALLLCAPLLMAPSCLHRSVHPTFCTGCTPADAESQLQQAGANSVLVLGADANWDVLEPCDPCAQADCSDVPEPARMEEATIRQCSWPDGSQSACWCGYDTGRLEAYLMEHVAANGQRGRRNFMVQLAPIFYTKRTTPAYLRDLPFNASTMKERYAAMLDRAMDVIEPHITAFGDPYVTIGLGNEVNAYLNQSSDRFTAWAEYIDFLTAAKRHLDGRNHLTFETVTTTWLGHCGLGQSMHPDPALSWPCIASGATTGAYNAGMAVDHFSFTYYPDPRFGSSDLRSFVAADFDTMSSISSAAGRTVVLQEVGYPSRDSLATQQVFVDAVFDNWANHYDRIKAVNYFNLHDFNPGDTICSEPDGNWSCSWGLFDHQGNDKGAWNRFVQRMHLVPVN